MPNSRQQAKVSRVLLFCVACLLAAAFYMLWPAGKENASESAFGKRSEIVKLLKDAPSLQSEDSDIRKRAENALEAFLLLDLDIPVQSDLVREINHNARNWYRESGCLKIPKNLLERFSYGLAENKADQLLRLLLEKYPNESENAVGGPIRLGTANIRFEQLKEIHQGSALGHYYLYQLDEMGAEPGACLSRILLKKLASKQSPPKESVQKRILLLLSRVENQLLARLVKQHQTHFVGLDLSPFQLLGEASLKLSDWQASQTQIEQKNNTLRQLLHSQSHDDQRIGLKSLISCPPAELDSELADLISKSDTKADIHKLSWQGLGNAPSRISVQKCIQELQHDSDPSGAYLCYRSLMGPIKSEFRGEFNSQRSISDLLEDQSFMQTSLQSVLSTNQFMTKINLGIKEAQQVIHFGNLQRLAKRNSLASDWYNAKNGGLLLSATKNRRPEIRIAALNCLHYLESQSLPANAKMLQSLSRRAVFEESPEVFLAYCDLLISLGAENSMQHFEAVLLSEDRFASLDFFRIASWLFPNSNFFERLMEWSNSQEKRKSSLALYLLAAYPRRAEALSRWQEALSSNEEVKRFWAWQALSMSFEEELKAMEKEDSTKYLSLMSYSSKRPPSQQQEALSAWKIWLKKFISTQ